MFLTVIYFWKLNFWNFLLERACVTDIWKKLDMCNDIREGAFILYLLQNFSIVLNDGHLSKFSWFIRDKVFKNGPSRI